MFSLDFSTRCSPVSVVDIFCIVPVPLYICSPRIHLRYSFAVVCGPRWRPRLVRGNGLGLTPPSIPLPAPSRPHLHLIQASGRICIFVYLSTNYNKQSFFFRLQLGDTCDEDSGGGYTVKNYIFYIYLGTYKLKRFFLL